MNAEFFDAVADIEKEKGIPREYMYEKIRQAMLTAFRKDTPDCEDNVEVILDETKKKIEMVVKKTVVERVIDPYVEISEEAAHRISKRAKVGDIVSVPVETKQFGRIAAQAAKQVIIQGIREAERGMIYEEFNSKEHEILTGVVNKIDPRTGCAFLKISSNSDYTEAMLAPAECIRGEELHEGDRIKVYVVEVRNSTRGPQVLISRTHPGLVKRLFELEVPEIFDGTVEIKSIAREAGSRTKLAVLSHDENVDAVGACIGPRGARVAGIVDELGGAADNVEVPSGDGIEGAGGKRTFHGGSLSLNGGRARRLERLGSDARGHRMAAAPTHRRARCSLEVYTMRRAPSPRIRKRATAHRSRAIVEKTAAALYRHIRKSVPLIRPKYDQSYQYLSNSIPIHRIH